MPMILCWRCQGRKFVRGERGKRVACPVCGGAGGSALHQRQTQRPVVVHTTDPETEHTETHIHWPSATAVCIPPTRGGPPPPPRRPASRVVVRLNRAR